MVTQTTSSGSQSILDIYKNRELVRSPESMDQLRNMLVDIAKQVLIFYEKAQQEVRDLQLKCQKLSDLQISTIGKLDA